jgi:acyl carrier protein
VERDQALVTFRASLSDLLGVEPEELGMHRTWEELDVDSLGQVEVALVLCEAFDICLPEVDSDLIRTVGQVFELTLATVNDDAAICDPQATTA